MKSILLISSLVIAIGCAQIQNITSVEPPKTIRSPNCIQSPHLKVMQVLDNGILAYVCPVTAEYPYKTVFEGCWIKGDLTFMEVPEEHNQFVDDQELTLPDDTCFVPAGTYKYTTKDNIKKTVRLIGVMDSQIPNPAYEEVKK